MKINFSFNKLIIIESLRKNEIKTGSILYNDLIRWKTLEFGPLDSELIQTSNKQSFFEALKRINEETKKGLIPFIHFEIHGSRNLDGFVLASGETVSWSEVGDLTRKINISTKNNLIISLATCFGTYFITSIDINKTAPFASCISTTDTISVEEIEIDFGAFFETILSSTDFNLAVENLNKRNNPRNKYNFFTAEEFLEMLFKKIESEDFNPKSIVWRKWVNSLARKLREINSEYASLQKKHVKEEVRRELQNHKSSLRSSLKKEFLMAGS